MLSDSEAPGIEDAYAEDGVDLTLIRWMLSLTPAEIAVKEEAGRERDLAVLPVLRRTLEEIRRQSSS